MNVYHVGYNLVCRIYSLTAYEVFKETPKHFKVKTGKAIIGHNSYRNVLDKSDPNVFTSFEAANLALVIVIKKMIDRNNNENWQMQNNIEALGKLSEDNWKDIVGVK